MTYDTSGCLSQQDISRLATGSLQGSELSLLTDHLDQCERCQNTLAEFTHQTLGLEKSLSKLTLVDIENAGNTYNQEQAKLTAELGSRLGEKASKLAEQTALFSTPCQLGQYELHGLIAPGGMGEVYRASHRRLKREVAIKVIRRNQQENRVFYQSFLREIETLGQLDHPNMVRAFDAIEYDGYLFLVMEFLDGVSLKESARNHQPLSLTQVLDIMLALTRAVGHLHDNGYLHLDIKPSNVMVLKESPPKLIDYGLALPLSDASQPGVMIRRGTEGYMPPEQLSSGRVSQRTDIYGTGKVFSFLLGECLDSQLSRRQLLIIRSLEQLISEMTMEDPSARLSDASMVEQRLTSLSSDNKPESSLLYLGKKTLAPIASKYRGISILGLMVIGFVISQLNQGSVVDFKAKSLEEEKRVAWTNLLADADFTNSIGMPFNLIPDGQFDTETKIRIGDESFGLKNTIAIRSPIYIGTCEVTLGQYREVMGDHESQFFPEGPSSELLPVESLSIDDAIEFCRRLSNRESEKQAGRLYRIPTSDEWEFACRAGGTGAFSFGDKAWQMDTHGWYNGNAGQPKVVGKKRANGWGLYDTHGNVHELVMLEDDEMERIHELAGSRHWWGFRGGSWAVSADYSTCNQLYIVARPDLYTGDGSVGFRVVCDMLAAGDDAESMSRADSLTVNSNQPYIVSIDLRGTPNPPPLRTLNAKLFRESESVHYWTTDQLNEWAEIEYLFELPSPVEAVVEFEHLAWVYNDNHYPSFDPECQGTVEVAGDDGQWHVIFHSESGTPVVDNRVNVLPLLVGSTSVGLRAKLFAKKKGKNDYFSQFLRRGDHVEPHQLGFILRKPQ